MNIKYDLGMMHVFSSCLQFRYDPEWQTGGHFRSQKTYFALVHSTRRIQKIAVLVKIHYYATFSGHFHLIVKYQIGPKMADWLPFYCSENIICFITRKI